MASRWLLKAAVQGATSLMPYGERLNYVMQRRVSHRLPRTGSEFDLQAGAAARHLAAFDAVRPGVERATLNCYEFGAGWDLIGPISMWTLGVQRQTILDIRPNVKLELVNATIGEFARDPDRIAQVLGEPPRPIDPSPLRTLAELPDRFGIHYLAPADARAVPLPDRSIDFVTSTFTLEHIPAPVISAILNETRRVLAPAGVVSSAIDMQDHYSYIDPQVSVYNYLTFSSPIWRFLNPSLQWQNRLRHSQYLSLFRDAGYEILTDEPQLPTTDDLRRLASLRIAPEFRDFDPVDLATRSTLLLVAPNSMDRPDTERNE